MVAWLFAHPPNTTGTFVFDQDTPADTWTITHNLGKYPSVVIVDSTRREVVGNVTYQSRNVVVVSFAAAFSGHAYCN